MLDEILTPEAAPLADITQHEIRALRTTHNLADAHTHQRQSLTQHKIVARLPQLWYESEETTQYEQEQKFIRKFFELHRQTTAPALNRTMLFYAASIAMMTAANFFQRRRLTVSLIDPCFDNLHDILRNMHVPLLPLREELLEPDGGLYERLAQTVTGDVICLVDPNNPTGTSILMGNPEAFEALIKFCKDHKKILMIDLCFAAFGLMDSEFGRYDVYELLEASGVTYIMIEDTGKTWPIQDAKCAMLTCSLDLYPEVYNIHTSVLLNVSPFILNMLSAYFDDSMADGFQSVRSVLDQNRQMARQALAGSMLKYVEPKIKVSVAWFEISGSLLTASRLSELAYGRNVYVLSGTYFFWSRKNFGERYIRVALAREPSRFSASIQALREVCDGH